MIRAARSLALAAAAASFALAWAPSASADPAAEGAAKTALKRASEKYLATDFAAAAAILKKASRGCGTTRCSAGTRAALLRDTGVMQFRVGDKAAAHKAFADALALDPGLTLSADYDAPDVRAAFDAAKPGGAKAGGAAESTAAPPAGDFTHTPATEQKVNTPLPVYAETSGSEIKRAVVKYKGAAMNDWARVEMKRMGDGWGALIPCGAVTAGTMKYWIQGFDTDGNAAASSGDAKHPFEVPIQDEITSEAPHFPDRSAPQTCEEGEGTERRHAEREEEEPEEPSSEGEKKPVVASSAYARWWIGFAGAIDFLSLPGASDACTLNSNNATPVNTTGYYCTNPDGSDFPSRIDASQNSALIPGAAGTVGGGLQPGDVRAFIAVDYALSPAILVGGRLGYVLNTYPSGDAAVVRDHRAFGSKVHVEARGTYVFGDAPLTHEGFAPTVFAAAGMAPFDGHVASIVSMSQKMSTVPISQPVNVWRTDGPWFLAVGGGVRYQLSPRAAFNAAVRVNAAFGGSGALFTYGPEIAFQYGF
jgi:hypothetical protein